jgi:uncharacterized MAPEG superfamily protein
LFKYLAFHILKLHIVISIPSKHEHFLLHSKHQPRNFFHLCFQFLTATQIPPALILALLPRFYSGLSGPGAKLFDRNNPRGFNDVLKTAELDDEVHLYRPRSEQRKTSLTQIQLRGRLLRAEAASANGFEALPFYAAAVTAGNAAGVSATTMNVLSAVWLVSRLAYNYVYIWHQATEILAPGQTPLRFKVWSVGTMVCLSMYVMAGLKAS